MKELATEKRNNPTITSDTVVITADMDAPQNAYIVGFKLLTGCRVKNGSCVWSCDNCKYLQLTYKIRV